MRLNYDPWVDALAIEFLRSDDSAFGGIEARGGRFGNTGEIYAAPCMTRRLEAVDIPAMPNCNHQDDELLVADRIDDSVVSGANSV